MKVWPKLADWWASRSRRKLEERIQYLEDKLSKLELLPVSTEFENRVLTALTGLFMIISLIPCLVITGYLEVVRRYLPVRTLEIRQHEAMNILLWMLLATIGLAGGFTLGRFQIDQSAHYRAALRKNIEDLKRKID